MMDSTYIQEIIAAFADLRIGVIGDFCLDVYWELDNTVREVSLETGLNSIAVHAERMCPGGASNVAVNLKSIGVGTVLALGVVGEDPYGGELRAQLESTGIETAGIHSARGWHTHMFVKSLTNGVEGPRTDIGNYNALAERDADAILSALAREISSLDALIVNQQVIPAATMQTPYLRTKLLDLIQRSACEHVFVDSRDHAGDFPGTIRKMNNREVAAYSGEEHTGGPEAMAIRLAEKWKAPLVVTQGDRETLVVCNGTCDRIPAVSRAGAVLDTAGAGDSFVAGLCASVAAGANLAVGAQFANIVAGVTITKVGQTGVATPAEIIDMNETGNWILRPDLADSPAAASYLDGSEIEIIDHCGSDGRITHAVFDHDGTVSTLREGWESVMEPMMLRCIVGSHGHEIPPATRTTIRARVREFIEGTTGVQTLVQMKGLAQLVREYGFVPEDDIRDEHGYKKIYNTLLLQRVNRRLAKLEAGELHQRDFAICGSVEFARALADRGIRLYLASGTDQEDVRREANLLGYADLFEGGIHGAVGSLAAEAKREVLHRILLEIDGGGPATIAVFGDGPVEIREATRVGGLAVGVASDEVRRFGLNIEKRRRLVRAGAHVIVPDFSQGNRLLEWMVLEGLL